MFRGALVGLIALVASANAFIGLVPAVPRTTCSSGGLKMVTQPRVSAPGSSTKMPPSMEPVYTETLQKMEKEALADLEKTFDDIAKQAEAESDALWDPVNKDVEKLEKENAGQGNFLQDAIKKIPSLPGYTPSYMDLLESPSK